MIKILFLNSINYGHEVESRYPNLGIYYIISSLEKFNADIPMDIRVCKDNVENEISGFKPDIVAISSVTQNYGYARTYSRIAKKHGALVIIGGVHITAAPESLAESMNIGVLGEGEYVFADLIRIYSEFGKIPWEKAKTLPGIIIWRNGEVIYSDKPPCVIEDLNSLPMPARDRLSPEQNNSIITSRGCPHKCGFCSSQAFWSHGKRVRFLSPSKIAEELEYIAYNRKNLFIDILDDLFCANRNRIRELIKILDEKKLLNPIKYHVNCRADYINDELAELLELLGVKSVGIGFESNNQAILTYLKGEKISIDDNLRAIQILKNHKISIRGTFIIGSPGEGHKEIMDTYEFISKNPIDLFDVFILTPYPGTPIWKEAVERGILDKNIEPSKLNLVFGYNTQNNIILSDKFSRDELLKYYRKFKMLRLRKVILNIWRTPYLKELPKYIKSNLIILLGKIRERISA